MMMILMIKLMHEPTGLRLERCAEDTDGLHNVDGRKDDFLEADTMVSDGAWFRG